MEVALSEAELLLVSGTEVILGSMMEMNTRVELISSCFAHHRQRDLYGTSPIVRQGTSSASFPER